MKILIINFQRTGDIFQSFQVIFALKKNFNNCKISYITTNVHSNALEIVSNYLDKIYPVDYFSIFNNLKSGYYSKTFSYLKKLIDLINRENFNLIINLNFSKLSAIFMSLTKGVKKEGASLMNSEYIEIKNDILNVMYENLEAPDFTTNIVEAYLKSLNLVYAKPLLFPPGKGMETGTIIIHPGASRKEKEWGIANYAELAVMLKKNVIITGGDSEIEKNFQLEKNLKKNSINVKNLTGKLTFLKLLEIFSKADLLVSGDTSIVHLAALTPIKSVTLFLGNAYHHHTYPYCSGKTVIFPLVKCYPCSANYNCNNMICKKNITPELVFKAINNGSGKNILTTCITNDGYVSLLNP